ncbi:MAG: response regulator [SAR324 cluster bacterium]|nr:response regulator [SAR324 cluster bacterium]
MAVLVVILMCVLFITADVLVRLLIQKRQNAKLKSERENALYVGLRLEFTDEAKSLKRVEVSNPKAWILAVDDEQIVLDSFRKILVMAGYSIDTVETGQEALGLVQKNNYDFVFTDFKMPDMNGLDVTKAVKHFRPDVDVIMITGYATIESAVETMKHGAMDYVQKPFTEDELVAFVNKTLIRRQDRIERERRPTVHLVTPSQGASSQKYEINIPTGLFITPKHTWMQIELNGMVRMGIDDFVQKIIGEVDGLELPVEGTFFKKGDLLFTIRQGNKTAQITAPISGQVALVNSELTEHLEYLNMNPYELGWICRIEPQNLPEELQTLKIGGAATSWYQEEIDRFQKLLVNDPATQNKEATTNVPMNEKTWEAFCNLFLR